jgi:hypothetical protein
LLLSLVALAVLGGVFSGSQQTAAEPHPHRAAAVQDSPQDELALALKHRPVYNLKLQRFACDRRGEGYEPTIVELVASGDERFSLVIPGQQAIVGPVIADLSLGGSGSYLNFPGNPRRPGCRFERDFQALAEDVPSTIYAAVRREEGREGFALQYWTFWYFNDWNNTHEGDWEMIEIIFETDSVAEALEVGPASVVYAQHGTGERHEWDSARVEKDGDRPVVYPSAGSHASYFSADSWLGVGEDGAGLGCDISTGPHRRLDTEVVLVPSDPAGFTGEFSWLTFEGRWGEAVAKEFNGPTGPQHKRVWREPLSWAEDRRGGSARVPGNSVLGVGGVDAFCDLIEGGSNVIKVFLDDPILIGTALGLVLVPGVVAGGVVLRDAARDPQIAQFAIKRRRGTGRIMRTAGAVYRRNFLLFLGISFIFFPLGLLLTLVNGLIFSAPFIEDLLWVFDRNPVSRLMVAMLVGGVGSVVGYLVVMAASVAALDRLERGESVTITSAYKAAFSSIGHILLARLRTLLLIDIVGLTVVGLPIAIWLAVRWYFIEMAVVLERESHWTAPASSACVVKGRWWRTAMLVIFFGLLGMLAGPLLAFGLLLGTDLEPRLINVISGLFQTVTFAYFAISLCLVYGDLWTRAQDAPIPTSVRGGFLGRAHRLVIGRWLGWFEGDLDRER